MTSEVRHPYRGTIGFGFRCLRCGAGRTSPIHRLNGRCSVCLRIFKQYELDDSRRCRECAP